MPPRPVPAGSVADHNREVFDAPDVVEDYVSLHGLFPCESALFDAWIETGDRVLDLGVGTGRTTGDLVSRVGVGNYLGIDLAPAMIAAAREAHPGVDLRVGDAADLRDVEDGSVGVAVFSFNGLDYVHPYDERQRCLRELHRVVRPGGVVIIGGHEARTLLRWLPEARGGPLRRAAASALASAHVARVVLPSAAFWRGCGYRADVARGLVTYATSRRRFRAEVSAHGFELVATLAAQHPSSPPAVLVPWWLHVLRRR